MQLNCRTCMHLNGYFLTRFPGRPRLVSLHHLYLISVQYAYANNSDVKHAGAIHFFVMPSARSHSTSIYLEQ